MCACKWLGAWLLALLMASSLPCLANPTASDREELVRQFVAAFNAHDAQAMADLVTVDVQWLSVDGERIAVEADGKSKLQASMSEYFKSCPTCRSTLHGVNATAQRLTAIEVARWQNDKGAQQQRSVSVYEFSGAAIRRVYYFPAEP